MRYHFGAHTLDLDTVELRHDGEVVVLEPRTFAVLHHLIRHRDRVVPKEELLDEVWGDRFVGESALTSQIKHVRGAVGDDGRAQRVVKTLHRVGYRFIADVTEDRDPQAAAPSAPAPTAWSPPHGRLFGRSDDLAAIRWRLTDHRLVTITGPGGVGKSTVARALLAEGRELGPDGPWLCELGNTRDPATIGNVLLAALGHGQQSDADAVESSLRALERRRSLLVFDNCEHVLDAARELVVRVLERCPELRVVATSRMPLGIDGEGVVPLSPLDLDASIACFVARAGDHGATVERDDPALAELCRRLDGVPLALELAAARARLLSPADMLELLSSRFRLLRGAGREGDERHQSLHRAISWSWEDLRPEDQELLARLSVFVGDFTLEDARAVAMGDDDPLDAVDALGRLVHRSLVVAEPAPSGHTRFRLLESVRDFAAERLRDGDAVRAQHAAHFAALAEALDAALQTDAIDDALGAMAAAWDNLRAAVRYRAGAGDARTVRRILRAVGPYSDVFQLYEVLDWSEPAELEAGLSLGGDERVIAADALAVKARMLAHRGHHEEASRLADLAHATCETHATLLAVVWCAYYRGELDVVVRSAERLLELSRSGRGVDRGFAEGFAAIVVAVRQESVITSTPVTPSDARRGLLGVQDCLTEGLRLCASDPETASELLEAVVDASIEHDYRLHLGAAASTLTQITLPGRPPLDAMRTLRRTLALYLERGMWVLISADTMMAAKLLADQGDEETACRLVGARAASGYAVGLSEVLRAVLEADLRERLGDRFAELAAQGASWRPPEAGEVAIAALTRAIDSAVEAPA